MAILVTGAKGYIGSHLCQLLQSRGETVIKLDDCGAALSQEPESENFIHKPIAQTKLYDLTDRGITEVVHLAALVNAAESVTHPFDYYATNVMETMHLLGLLKGLGTVKSIVFASSAAVYDKHNSMPVSISATCRPENPYGSSKLIGEIIVKDLARDMGAKHGILRFFNVAGAAENGSIGPHEGVNGVVQVLARCAIQKKPFVIYGDRMVTDDGTAVRDYVHVEDVATAIYATLGHLGSEDGGSFTSNVCTGSPTSITRLVRAMRNVTRVPIECKFESAREGEVPEMVGTNRGGRLFRETLWEPKRSTIENICRTAYKWELNLHQAAHAKANSEQQNS